MAEPWLPKAQEFGKLLAQLDPGERKRAEEIMRVTVAANAAPGSLDEQPPITTLKDYLENPPPVPPELVTPRYLARGSVTATIARAGVGKTSLHLNRLIPWAVGRPMFDKYRTAFVPTEPLKILIIENEGAGGLFWDKIKTMLDTAGDRFTEEEHERIRENILIWGEGGYAGVKLDDPKWLTRISRGIETHTPDVVLLEPFARLHDGDENDNTAMNKVGSTMEALAAKYKISVIVAHHENKAKHESTDELMNRSRGATALEGFVGYMEFFQRVRGNQQRELLAAKNRYAPMPQPLRMEWRADNSGWYDYIAADKGIDEILELLDHDEPRYTSDIAEELDEAQHRIRNLLKQAHEESKVERIQGHSTGAGSSGYGWLLAGEGDEPTTGPEF